MEKGEFVVVLEKKKEAYMMKGYPYAIIDKMIGSLTDRTYLGADRKVVLYLDDCACTGGDFAINTLGINREVVGIGTVYGNMVICNTETDGWETNLCGFTEEGAKAAIAWAEQYTTIIEEEQQHD